MMKPYYEKGGICIYHGDCRDVLPTLEAKSVDAIVTDPPYGLEFMGKDWDRGVPGAPFWEAALRVVKPGTHLLAFGGTRTFHRLTCAIEDAGWEIRDCIGWIYGSGFPKSLDVSKAIDKALFTTRTANPDFQQVRRWLRLKVKAKRLTYRQIDAALGNENSHKASHYLDNSQPQLPTPADWQVIKGLLDLDETADIDRPPKLLVETWEREIIGYREVHRGVAFTSEGPSHLPITKPLSVEAEQWEGWGTALKPAWEPIIVARKPLAGTVAANVLEWGTGAMNVDGCRIGLGGVAVNARTNKGRGMGYHCGDAERRAWTGQAGRWPANLIHNGSEDVLRLFPQNTGAAGGKDDRGRTHLAFSMDSPRLAKRQDNWGQPRDGLGSAARFFYCAKASRSERGEGNDHPTVKPLALMRWLCRLVTSPGGLILDPFAGSASTGIAAYLEGFRLVGVEQDAHNCEIAARRLEQTVLPLEVR